MKTSCVNQTKFYIPVVSRQRSETFFSVRREIWKKISMKVLETWRFVHNLLFHKALPEHFHWKSSRTLSICNSKNFSIWQSYQLNGTKHRAKNIKLSGCYNRRLWKYNWYQPAVQGQENLFVLNMYWIKISWMSRVVARKIDFTFHEIFFGWTNEWLDCYCIIIRLNTRRCTHGRFLLFL